MSQFRKVWTGSNHYKFYSEAETQVKRKMWTRTRTETQHVSIWHPGLALTERTVWYTFQGLCGCFSSELPSQEPKHKVSLDVAYSAASDATVEGSRLNMGFFDVTRAFLHSAQYANGTVEPSTSCSAARGQRFSRPLSHPGSSESRNKKFVQYTIKLPGNALLIFCKFTASSVLPQRIKFALQCTGTILTG